MGKIIVKKVEGGYEAIWDNASGKGKTHMEALKALHYMMNFFNGTIENPTPLPVNEFDFQDFCKEDKCPCGDISNTELGQGLKKVIEDIDEECPTCGGTGEVGRMEAVYPGEPHMADVGTQPCPDCQSNEPDDDHE